jgi:hypothetical protein
LLAQVVADAVVAPVICRIAAPIDGRIGVTRSTARVDQTDVSAFALYRPVLAFTPGTLRGGSATMLVIRESQMKSLGLYAQEQFAAQMCDIFVQAYPRECRQAGGPSAMLRWARTGLNAAAAAGYLTEYENGRWLALMLILGVDFAIDPQLPWVRDCLDPRAIPDSTQRIDLLFERTLDYLGDTAGKDAGYEVRAMLRMRAIDFQSLPALPDAAAVADACDRLRVLYPRKFAFQGPEVTASAVAQQLPRARELGLAGPAGEFLFVVLSFMLGSGFDHDPLQPWASAILHPTPGDGANGDRAARLEAAAREHLAQSLSKV